MGFTPVEEASNARSASPEKFKPSSDVELQQPVEATSSSSSPSKDGAVEGRRNTLSRSSSTSSSSSSSSGSNPDTTTSCKADTLKAQLKSLLEKYNGCTKNDEVTEVIEELSKLNPTVKNCSTLPLFTGDFFALTSPNFPGRLPTKEGEEDVIQYTLGRMSFNIFQPKELVCTLRGVRNLVYKNEEPDEKGRQTFDYKLILDITIHTADGDLPATLVNDAYTYENPDVNNRLMVSFTGGTLMPATEVKSSPEKLDLWATTFKDAYKDAEEQRSYLGRVLMYILQLLMGLTLPTDDSALASTFHFDMKRSPVGYMDLLYLDEEFRITKGNRGTIVVVERAGPTTTQPSPQEESTIRAQ